MSSSIPIANLYYLLCYAWDRLDQGNLVDVSSLPSTELADLFALVLCDGIHHLARRGLEQSYDVREEELGGIRGRIDISQSLRRSLFFQGRAHCRFDELTVDTSANRILKSTLVALLELKELDPRLRHRAYRTSQILHGIRPVRLSQRDFESVRVTSNNLFYRFLLNVCKLVFESLLVDERTGETRFRDFTRDEAKMALLFQSFLFNFIARECSEWKVKAENIAWQATSVTDPELRLLPRMQTDISAFRPGEYRIIDAKFYQRSVGSYFGSEKFHSDNLYQICSYLLNARPLGHIQASGVLIYPRVDRQIRQRYEIAGRTVSIYTVDLSAPWQAIDKELRELML
jgi:5-methylcytosine-specific restriction enzyme subunit McrC